MWELRQFKDVFNDFRSRCDIETRTTLDRRLALLRKEGPNLREPHAKHLEDQIYELRAKAARLLYFFRPNYEVVIVLGVFKSEWKSGGKAHKKRAKSIRERISEEGVIVRGIDFSNRAQD